MMSRATYAASEQRAIAAREVNRFDVARIRVSLL